jgi:Flp pilus assembly protein TadB
VFVRRRAMIVVLAVILAGIAAWLWVSPHDPAERVRRARRRTPSSGPAAVGTGIRTSFSSFSPSAVTARPPVVSRRPSSAEATVCVVIGVTVFLVLGGVPGVILGAVGSIVALGVLQRRESSQLRRERERVTADLPLAADLIVACLRAGQPITGAIDVTVDALGGPLGDRLVWVSGQLRLGAAPESAWRALAAEPPLAPLARAMGRAALSGAPMADVLTRLSDDSRHAARAVSSAAARRVGVQAVAPLGLCFLPAFVFLGIIPVVAVLAGDVLLP